MRPRYFTSLPCVNVADRRRSLLAQGRGRPVVARLPRPRTPAPPRPAAPRLRRRPKVTSPKEEWGHNIGDDYFLANYQQLIAYWHKLEKESNRVHVVEIGRTAENRPMLMAIITSPANYAKIDRYKSISAQLANATAPTARC